METIDTPTIIAPVRTPVVAPQKNEEPKLPPMYAIILHNDPSTPYYVVTDVLTTVFNVEPRRSVELTMLADRAGKALVKICSKDVAETQVEQSKTFISSIKGGNGLNPNAPCELTFTAEPESDGDK